MLNEKREVAAMLAKAASVAWCPTCGGMRDLPHEHQTTQSYSAVRAHLLDTAHSKRAEKGAKEYLRARGWESPTFEYDDGWTHRRHPKRDAHGRIEHGDLRRFTIVEAVETQLAEDRAALAFVFSRSIFKATLRDGSGLTVDFTDATIEAMSKEHQR